MSGTPGRVGVVDIGTNTVRLLVAERVRGEPRILDEFGEVTSLGASLIRTERIERDDAERSFTCLVECVRRAGAHHVQHLDLAGTEVFRRASNGREVAADFSRRLGQALRILSPEEEADAAYAGAVAWPGPPMIGPITVLDVGGGSTELIRGVGENRLVSRSVPLGALTVTDRWLGVDPPGAAAVAAARANLAPAVTAPLVEGLGLTGEEHFLALGGSACAIAAWVNNIRPYLASLVHGLAVERVALGQSIDVLAAMTAASRSEHGGIGEGRARVLPGGALLIEAVLFAAKRSEYTASVFGLRHGLVLAAWRQSDIVK